jgi:hypothetical protein
MWSEPDIEKNNSNGLWFAPMCKDCLLVNKYIGIGEKLGSYPWKEHWLNATGKYILFPSVWFHRGYFKRRWRKVYMQAQLFAVPSGNQCMDQSTCSVSQGNKTNWVTGKLDMSPISDLSQDLLNFWDKNYPASVFKPCKAFQGLNVNPSANQKIEKKDFQWLPLIQKLVDHFKTLFLHQAINQVWLL